MAGVKGKSGGKRVGAGRKPLTDAQKAAQAAARAERAKAKAEAIDASMPADAKEPLPFLEAVMNNAEVDIKVRVRAAIAAAQYRHTKRGDGGKKDETADKAKKVASSSRFRAAPSPLALVKR
jgi:phage terminase small subunit